MTNYNIIRDLTKIGKQYTQKGLDEIDLRTNPVEQFINWIDVAINEGISEPNAMILSTVSTESKPSSRVVLLKYICDIGFIFFTNYQSLKGRQLESNSNVSAVFFWSGLERQVRIEGYVKETEAAFSDNYFKTRPFDSQLGAIVSPQSQVIESREYLLDKKNELEQSFKNKKLIRPYYWGGFILIPESVEFWQGRPNRLSDRFRYRLEGTNWVIERLAP
jgi:pyridoxamine 5'-phosphate oxidase